MQSRKLLRSTQLYE